MITYIFIYNGFKKAYYCDSLSDAISAFEKETHKNFVKDISVAVTEINPLWDFTWCMAL